ncbi:MAG: single-strand DNA-binding protein [Candidatus Peregrinibacteria bacterium Gr01-1014_25]|nr:MAG: single-strand DNA-binding protein [Candidatus Peregrinibacteria bacterium Gr01-1014_25]
MFSLNRIQLIGYQTQPVSVRQTPQGTSVTDLNIVVPYQFKADGGDVLTGKSFHTVTLWGPMAQVAGQFVRAGAQVFIAGRLQTDSWEDEQSGEKRSKTKVVAQELILLDPKDGQGQVAAGMEDLIGALNRADIVGNVTRDPEVRTTTGGQSVLTLGVATNERWKDKASGETRDRSEFHNVVVWGELATRLAQTVRKGNRVYVTGRVQTRAWETQSGSKRTTTEVIAETVSLLGMRNPAIADVIQMDGAPMTVTPRAKTQAPTGEEPVTAGIPPIDYTPEIRVEDLPF